MSTSAPTTRRVRVLAPVGDRHDEILTPAALDFVGSLVAAFGDRRLELLKERRRQALRLASGSPLDFPMVTSAVRADPAWRVAPPAPGLTDRRVEITGPPDRRMAVNALNSGAKVWMADFEDATAPPLGQRHRRAAQPARRHRTADRLHHAGGQGIPAG